MQNLNLIAGSWCPADSGGTFPVLDPADDGLVAEVPECGIAETRRAIEAAHAAHPPFLARPAAERVDMLRRLSALMDDRVDELASILTSEQGKPLAEARGEIAYARSYLDGAAWEAERMAMVEELDPERTGKAILVRRAAVGATAAITPWNFPIAMLTKKVGPAFAMGCTMVLKPAEHTPLSALAFGELCIEAGVPDGVMNIVTGSPEVIGEELMGNPLIRKVSFTGSTEVGRILVRGASRNLPRLALELGGHAPFIVLEDADVELAVAGAMSCKFRNAGQACISANRFLVHEAVHDRFVERLVEAAGRLVVGRGTDDGVDIGPVIDDASMAKIDRHVRDALDRGARCELGGGHVHIDGLTDRFHEPTVLTGCTPEMLCFREETFGPVCPVMAFSEIEEAIRIANDSPFGLAGYLWTSDRDAAIRLAPRLEVGVVGINDPSPVTTYTPFGGMKQSGWGREGGRAGLEEYVPLQTISIGPTN
ncbi:MAG: NAD-dependent succinate-semialdehyde dehydrogenase [Phycisphaerales bacterium]|nr:NAD-dependent succinate-semialdehyde dehydrogenase [Phycisphaerales bacterium]